MSELHTSKTSTIPDSDFGRHLRFVLASGSKRRRDIMQLAGLTFVVQDGSGGDGEIDSETEPDVRRLTRYNAELKLKTAIEAARNRMPWNTVVVAADTAVAVDDRPLGKPADRAEALAMLRDLRGRQHEVVTCVALTYAPMRQRGELLAHSVVSQVEMRDYSDGEIDCYVATGIPYDRAGAYGIQDADFNPAVGVVGCYLNVVGLPLCAVRTMLPDGTCTFADTHVYVTCAIHEREEAS